MGNVIYRRNHARVSTGLDDVNRSIMEVQAQVEILEAEVSLLRRTENRTNSVEHAQRLLDAEGRLREALACAQELDLEVNRVQQHIRDRGSLAAMDAHNPWGPFAHQAGIRLTSSASSRA